MIIGVDFDGVIYNYDGNYRGGETPDNPIPGAVEALKTLAQEHEIVIHSMRARTSNSRKIMAEWLERHGIPYHRIARTKPHADVYIDDKALRFVDWQSTLEALEAIAHD